MAVKEIYRLDDLRNWPKATRGVDPPIRLGVFGDPVEQSLSPQFQNAALRHCGIAAQYARFHIQPQELSEALQRIKESDFIGVNLTVPHKIASLALMDDCDELAKKIGAINTVRIGDGKMIGLNTDGVGFLRAVRETFSVDIRDLRVLVLGAGGGARAIAFQCALEKCERLVIVNRDLEKATGLVEQLRPHFTGPRVLGPVARLEAISWNESALRFQLANTDLLVNATPLGLARNDAAPVASRLLAPHLIVLDTLYRSEKTPLVRAAEEAGARASDGRAMLVHQGAAAFEIWFERSAPIAAMRTALA